MFERAYVTMPRRHYQSLILSLLGGDVRPRRWIVPFGLVGFGLGIKMAEWDNGPTLENVCTVFVIGVYFACAVPAAMIYFDRRRKSQQAKNSSIKHAPGTTARWIAGAIVLGALIMMFLQACGVGPAVLAVKLLGG